MCIHEHGVVPHARAQRHPPRQVRGLVGVAQQPQVQIAQLGVAQHGRRGIDGIDGDLFGLLDAQRRRERQRHHRHIIAAGADHPVPVEVYCDLRRIDWDARVHLAEEFVLPIGRPADQLPGVIGAEQIPVRVQEPDCQRVREHAACPHHVEGRLLQGAIGEEHADRDRGFCPQLGDGLLLSIACATADRSAVARGWVRTARSAGRGAGFRGCPGLHRRLTHLAAARRWPLSPHRSAIAWPACSGRSATATHSTCRRGHSWRPASAACSTWRSRSTVGPGRARPTHR